MKTVLLLATALIAASAQVKERSSVVLEGAESRLVIDLGGGSIVDFRLSDQGLNPLVWANEGPVTELRAMAHFLCLDRWGQPSKAEEQNGMPFHGEATRVPWRVLRKPSSEKGWIHAELSASLPMAGLDVTRTVRLSQAGATFVVSETVINRNKLGRIYNMVQHPTIGPPFLDENTVVDSNAGKGFAQGGALPNPEEPSASWPRALKQGQPVDLRRLTNDHEPEVVSFVIDQEYGWTTACNASRELLIGYLWKSSDYPWFNVWRYVKDGKPVARGLEFGTTGLHQPFPVLVAKGRIFNRPIFTYLDAGESVTRAYVGFLARIPKDFKGVARAERDTGRLVLVERGSDRRIVVENTGF